MLMSCAVSSVATRTAGKEALAMESFSRALAQLPTIIADNAGYDSALLVANLRAQHNAEKNCNMGIGIKSLFFFHKSALTIFNTDKTCFLLNKSPLQLLTLIKQHFLQIIHPSRLLTGLFTLIKFHFFE